MKMSTQGTDPNAQPGKHVAKGGMYHLVINEYDDQSNSQYPKLSFLCEAVGGENADQIGKQVKHDLFLPEGSQFPESTANLLMNFGCHLGIYSKKQWDADLAAGRDAEIPFEDSVGMQFIGKVEMQPDKNDKTKLWSRVVRTYAVGDDDVIPVAKSADHIAVFGGKLPKSDGSFRHFEWSPQQKAKTQAAPSKTQVTKPANKPTQ